jgi:hypothetical protein
MLVLLRPSGHCTYRELELDELLQGNKYVKHFSLLSCGLQFRKV